MENHVVRFILHDGSENEIGEALIMNELPIFQYEDILSFETKYYIVAAAGPLGQNGLLDLNDACLVVSNGIEVSFNRGPLGPLEIQVTSDLICPDSSVVLQASLLNPNDGATFIWETPKGQIETTSNELIINGFGLEDAGEYLVAVQENGCRSNSLGPVIIGLEDAANLVNAGADQVLCGDKTTNLNGSLPEGASGFWATNSQVIMGDKNDPNTQVDSLLVGENQFLWVANTTSCLVIDTVSVYYAPAPELRELTLDLKADKAAVLLNKEILLTGGTERIPDDQLQFEIIKSPLNGTLEESEGGLLFTRNFDVEEEQTVEFEYEVCNQDSMCGDLCSRSKVILNVLFEQQKLVSILSKGIRPAGNNPTWRFTLLRNLSSANLMIVDRWGQAVYEKRFSSTDYNLNKGNTLDGWEGVEYERESGRSGCLFLHVKSQNGCWSARGK